MLSTRKGRTPATLLQDLVSVAELTGVSYSEATLRRVLSRFEAGFCGHSVQIRTTTKPEARRDLCFRYLDLESGENPLDLAERSGELVDDGHPIFGWLRHVEERCPSLGYGADFEACHGLAKIWNFLDSAHDPRTFLELPMPRAFRASLPLLRELHLDSVTIVGADYVQRSVNLYFRPSHATHRGPELLALACARLGFAEPTPAALAHAAQTGCIAFTYGWDAPEIERICFYVPGFHRDEVPDHHPHLRRFADGAPALTQHPRFIVGWSHGKSQPYLKIEDDYTGDVTEVFAEAMSVPMAAAPPASQRPSPALHSPSL